MNIREKIIKIIKEELSNEDILPNGVELFDKVDNSLMWVRVINNSFFGEKECDGQKYAIGCQEPGNIANHYYGGKSGMETYQLLLKYKKDGNNCFKTMGAITINKKNNFVVEMRQRNNQPPGSHSIESVSKEKMMDLFLDFLSKNFPEINKFSTGSVLSIPTGRQLGGDGVPISGHGWAAKSLWYIMKNYPTKFLDYVKRVPEVFNSHQEMIEKTLGEDFLYLDVNLEEEVKNNPEEFFNKINIYYKLKKDEIENILKNLNFTELLKNSKILQEIEKNINFYLDFLKPEEVLFLIKKLNIQQLILEEQGKKFSDLCKRLSEKGGAYKKMLLEIIDNNFKQIIEALGGKGIGLGRLMKILNSPKFKKHESATFNDDLGDYEYVFNDREGNRIKKVVSDDNLVLNDKERKNLLEKNKEYIKTFYDKPELNKDIEYLRFLIPNLPENSSKFELEKNKEQFIDYYDKKFLEGKSKFPGTFLYSSLYNQLKSRLGEKPRKNSFDFKSIWELNALKYPFSENITVFDMSVQDKNNVKFIKSLIHYFYKKIKNDYGKLEIQDGKIKLIPYEGKKEEIKQAMSDYFFLTSALNGFDTKDSQDWMSELIKKGIPLKAPTPKLVTWSKERNLYKKELD